MSKIIFFSIPAHGHTNPTIPVVQQLVNNGHEVWYYSFNEFQEKIEGAGARFIGCDAYLPPMSPEELEKKVGKDFAALIEMVVDTTIAMDAQVCREVKDFGPDCIVSDSVCFWGKLFAKKLEIPFICSTTTFAFNQHTARLMKRGFKELIGMFTGMPRINKKIKQLNNYGYGIKNFIALIQNDNFTDTIVYTVRAFQPMADTFSDRYVFVGPSIREAVTAAMPKNDRKKIYISLGTVLNQNVDFYKNCFSAFQDEAVDVVMAVGEKTDISSLGKIPDHFTVVPRVDQLAVLKQADVFITHCGMNSVNESIYFSVPMVLFPLHSEERAVANRAAELGVGVKLKNGQPAQIKEAVNTILTNETFAKNTEKLSGLFKQAGGPKAAAAFIEARTIKS